MLVHPPPSFSDGVRNFNHHLDKSYIAIALGDVVKGVLVATDSEYHSVQLQSWTKSSYREWFYAQPLSYSSGGISLNHKAIFDLPLLGYKNMLEHVGHAAQLVIQPDRLRRVTAEAFAPPPDTRSPPKGKGKGDSS